MLPYDRDHVPAGCADDQSLWVKRFWSRRSTTDGDVNLHVRLVGSPNERLALLFRDWLRSHSNAVPAYAAFKRPLAGAVADTGVYADVKDPVVDLVVTIAETLGEAHQLEPVGDAGARGGPGRKSGGLCHGAR